MDDDERDESASENEQDELMEDADEAEHDNEAEEEDNEEEEEEDPEPEEGDADGDAEPTESIDDAQGKRDTQVEDTNHETTRHASATPGSPGTPRWRPKLSSEVLGAKS